jgi:hypothetical protein
MKESERTLQRAKLAKCSQPVYANVADYIIDYTLDFLSSSKYYHFVSLKGLEKSVKTRLGDQLTVAQQTPAELCSCSG